MKNLTISLSLCTLLISSGANATLVPALGGQVVNDTDLNVTWLTNANLAAAETFGLARNVDLGGIPGVYPYEGSYIYNDGRMRWGGALKWIAAMNAHNYLGYNNWRLPTSDTCAGNNCTGSEMGHLFFSELGETAGQALLYSTDPDMALFTNLQSYYYWSGTTYALNSNYAWNFNPGGGVQLYGHKYYSMFALAVRDGQVAVVPVPAAAWLLGSGLLSLIGVALRKAA